MQAGPVRLGWKDLGSQGEDGVRHRIKRQAPDARGRLTVELDVKELAKENHYVCISLKNGVGFLSPSVPHGKGHLLLLVGSVAGWASTSKSIRSGAG